MIIFPPDLRNGRKFASSVLMCAKLACRMTPWSNAFANCAYDRFFQPLAPLPVALINDGVASVGSGVSSATMSVAIVNGAGIPVIGFLSASPLLLLLRASPTTRRLTTTYNVMQVYEDGSTMTMTTAGMVI